MTKPKRIFVVGHMGVGKALFSYMSIIDDIICTVVMDYADKTFRCINNKFMAHYKKISETSFIRIKLGELLCFL